MKRLLGLLMGMVGCGISIARLEDKGAKITKNEQGEVVKIDFKGKRRMNDAGMADLEGLAGLNTLWLNNTSITDAGLVHLKGLTNLRVLSLPSRITDAGLVHLKGMNNLEVLGLGNVQVTGAGVAKLHQILPKCSINH